MQSVRSMLAVLLVTMTSGACFATRNDMRILQSDILAFRQEVLRQDTVRARQLSSVATLLGVVSDSLEGTSARLALFEGDARGELRSMGQQMIQMQELVGQSQAIVQRLRAEQELRDQQQREAAAAAEGMATGTQTPPPAGAGAGAARRDTLAQAPVTTPPPTTTTPGPNQLFQDGLAQLRRGSYSSAEGAFRELLRLYPSGDLAPDAQYWLGEALEGDQRFAASDSAYIATVTSYPRSAKAPTALYKLGLSLAKRGKRAEAREYMDRVAREYPVTDEADLARDWMMRNR